MTQLTLDAAEGQRLKHEGLAQVAAKNAEWLKAMRLVARGLSEQYGQVTTDDLRHYVEWQEFYPTHHNAYGAIFHGKGWTVVGRQPSKLAGNHGREIKVWRWEGV